MILKQYNLFIPIFLLFNIITISSFESKAQNSQIGGENLEIIEIKHPSLYPEGIRYNNKTNKFLVSSLREGTIYEVDEQGNAKPLIKDNRLFSTAGIHVDTEQDKLYVTTSDNGISSKKYTAPNKLAALAIYNLSSGEPINFINLGELLPDELHLANAVTLDNDRNAYVTDSFAPVIYKIDPKGQASIFLRSNKFLGEEFNLNGIVFHPNGYLLTIKESDGMLFKIPLKNPENFSQIQLDNRFIGGDGLILLNKKELIVIANETSKDVNEKVFLLTSEDDWQNAKVIDSEKIHNAYVTTGVIKQNKIYVLNGNINELIDSSIENHHKLRHNPTIHQVGIVKP